MSPGRTGTTMPTVPTIVAVITRQPPTAFGSGGSQEGRVGDRLSDSAFVHGSGSRDLGESFRLVADVESLVLQRREVLPTVVRAEEQLSAGNEAGADVGLGPTSVAAVSSSQFGCQCCRHRISPLSSLGGPPEGNPAMYLRRPIGPSGGPLALRGRSNSESRRNLPDDEARSLRRPPGRHRYVSVIRRAPQIRIGSPAPMGRAGLSWPVSRSSVRSVTRGPASLPGAVGGGG